MRRNLKMVIAGGIMLLMAACQEKDMKPGSSPSPLTFYVISESKFPGGKMIDYPDLPRFGYVNTNADLVIHRLEAVAESKSIAYVGGKSLEKPSLVITFTRDDAKSFSKLTKRAVGKRVLITLGDDFLMAPIIEQEIQTTTLEFTNQETGHRVAIKAKLDKLVMPTKLK